MAKTIRKFSDGAVTADFETDYFNWDFKSGSSFIDGNTATGVVQAAWQNGAGSPDSGDKVQVILSNNGQETVYFEELIDSLDNTADCLLFNIDVPCNNIKLKFFLSGITSLELSIDYDRA